MKDNKRFILGVVGSDVHCVANQLIERELISRGFKVVNLGVAIEEVEVLEAIICAEEDVVLLGTLNGDIEPTINLIKSIKREFSTDVPVVVGGNLVLGSIGRDRTLDLLDAGATFVISNATSISEVISRLMNFLEVKSSIDA